MFKSAALLGLFAVGAALTVYGGDVDFGSAREDTWFVSYEVSGWYGDRYVAPGDDLLLELEVTGSLGAQLRAVSVSAPQMDLGRTVLHTGPKAFADVIRHDLGRGVARDRKVITIPVPETAPVGQRVTLELDVE